MKKKEEAGGKLSRQGLSTKGDAISHLSYDGRSFTPETFEEITGRKHISSSTPVNTFIDEVRKKLLVKNTDKAGLGLFAGEPIKAGETICPYSGEKIPSYQDLLHMSTKEQSDALFPINAHYYSDEGVLINHGPPNAIPYLKREGKGFSVLIKAIRDIKEEEEIFWFYGSSYEFDRLEHVNMDALVCMCEKSYEEIKDVKYTADSNKEVGSYNGSEYKLSSESFKSDKYLKEIQYITLLECIFTRPLVLLQLRMSEEFTCSKLNVLRDHFNFSGGIRDLRSEIYPWFNIVAICNMMELKDEHFRLLVSNDNFVALYDKVKNTTGYEEFKLAKFKLYKFFYQSVGYFFREFPTMFENNPLMPVTKAITECMLERNSYQFNFKYTYYVDRFSDRERWNDLLRKIYQKFPIFGDCLYDEGFKLKKSLGELVEAVLPQNIKLMMQKMIDNDDCKVTKIYMPVTTGRYRARLSVAFNEQRAEEIARFAEKNTEQVETVAKKGKSDSYKVYFGLQS
jgi:hypothetical protein